MGRVACRPFTSSDGTYIPEGTHLSVAVQATHLDDANYTDPYISVRSVSHTQWTDKLRQAGLIWLPLTLTSLHLTMGGMRVLGDLQRRC